MTDNSTTITRQQDVEHALRMLAYHTNVTLNSIVTAKRARDIKWGATAAALQNAQRVIEAMDENDQ